MTDEEAFASEADRLHKAGWGIDLRLDSANAIGLIALLQMAWRHPGVRMGPTGKHGMELARSLQSRLGEASPELERLLERGWHEVFDVA